MAVPKLGTYALIFGSLALGYVLLRRRLLVHPARAGTAHKNISVNQFI